MGSDDGIGLRATASAGVFSEASGAALDDVHNPGYSYDVARRLRCWPFVADSTRFLTSTFSEPCIVCVAILLLNATLSPCIDMSTSTVSTIAQRAKTNWVVTTVVGVVVLIFAVILSNPTSFLENYYGRVQSKDPKTRYLGHGSLNNGNCWTNPGERGIRLSDISQVCKDKG